MEIEDCAKSSNILKESDTKEWKTPSDVMQRFQLHRKTLKARLKRHPSESSLRSASVITSNTPELLHSSTCHVESCSFQRESTGTCARKRRNPFRLVNEVYSSWVPISSTFYQHVPRIALCASCLFSWLDWIILNMYSLSYVANLYWTFIIPLCNNILLKGKSCLFTWVFFLYIKEDSCE